MTIQIPCSSYKISPCSSCQDQNEDRNPNPLLFLTLHALWFSESNRRTWMRRVLSSAVGDSEHDPYFHVGKKSRAFQAWPILERRAGPLCSFYATNARALCSFQRSILVFFLCRNQDRHESENGVVFIFQSRINCFFNKRSAEKARNKKSEPTEFYPRSTVWIMSLILILL